MATKFHKFTGKLKWTQNITQVDDFRGTKNYKCNLVLDEASLKEFEESGIQTKPYTDSDGDTFHVFKRPPQKKIKEEIVEFGPPEYVDSEGNPVTVQVANGSEAEIEVVSYDTVMGKGHRLNKVTVTKLIEYVPEEPKGDKATNEAMEAAAFE